MMYRLTLDEDALLEEFSIVLLQHSTSTFKKQNCRTIGKASSYGKKSTHLVLNGYYQKMR